MAGDLALWWHRPRGGAAQATAAGAAEPVVIICANPGHEAAQARLAGLLARERRDLRVLTPPPGAGGSALAAGPEARPPAALVLLGDGLPAPLMAAALRAGVPVVLADARITRPDRWGLAALRQRRLLGLAEALLLTDETSAQIARDLGVCPQRITVTGPVTEIHDPLPCPEAERRALAALLYRRHVWLSCATPTAEIDAVIAAHRSALRQSHRALLILHLPGPAPQLADVLERRGLAVAMRAEDQDPTDDVQVLIVDDSAEMGLWYRLAPVCYMGGTLTGDDAQARHPFEPAALGAAIIHGPRTARHPAPWRQLDGAGAARGVADAEALARAVTDLAQPASAAALARNAWSVCTGGAGVVMQIAQAVLRLVPQERPA